MKQLENISEFKSSPAMKETLLQYGIVKTFHEGDLVLNENAYIKSIPIVITGSIRVMRTDEEGRYYCIISNLEKVALCLSSVACMKISAKLKP